MGVAILFKFVFSCFQVLAWPLLSLVYPLYASFEALERNSISDTQKLISYWICFAAISLFEYSASVLLQWVPFWAYVKLSIICCLVAPQFDGSLYMYKRFIHRYKNMKKRFCLRVSFILLETKNYFGEIEADQASQSSKEVEQPNVECRTEPKKTAAVEQTENAGVGKTKQITDIIANISHKSNEIEDKRSCEECQIGCIDVTAVERIENAGGGSTEQVTEIATDISLDKVEDRDSQHSLSIMKVQKEWTCEVCEMKTTGESDLQSHLPGKGHKVACEILKSKSGSTTGEQCTTGITTRKHINQHEADCELLKTHQSHGHATSIALPTILCNSRQHEQGTAKNCTTNEIKNHQWWCAICNISCTGKGNIDSHLKGSEHLAKIKNSLGDGDKGKTAAMPMQRAEPKDAAAVEQIENEVSLDKVEDQYSQASQSSKEVELPNVECRTEPKIIAAVEQTENAGVGKTKQITYRIGCIDVTAVERSENAGGGSTEQVTELTTDISLDKVEDRDSQDSLSIEKVQKEWTCEVCEVKTPGESDLQSHLPGKGHKVACEILKSKSGSTTGERCTTGITTRKHINQHEANCELLKTHQSHGHATSIALPTILCNSRQHEQGTAKNCTTNEIKNHQWWCALCNISCTGKGNMDSHLKGSEHMEKIKNSHGDGDKGKIAAMPMQRAEPKDVAAVEQIENEISLDVVEDQDFQDLSSIGKMQKKWTCEVCEVRTSSWSDLQSHLQGKRHKVNCEILKSKCEATTRELLKTHEPINNVMPPCYATSADLPTVPCNSKKQGAAKSCTSEIKDHQWRCALCNVRCKSKVDLNAHLNGSKHLAKIKRSHGDSGTGKTATMPKLKAEKEKTSKQNDLVKEPVLDGLVRNNGRRAGWWWSIQK